MPYRRMISAVLVPVMLLQFSGCTKTVWVIPEQLRPEDNVGVVVTGDGHEIRLDRARLRGDTIYTSSGEAGLRFAVDEVRGVGVQRPDPAATLLLVMSAACAALAVVGLISMAAEGG
jgi:hypothetical protein